ncbi:MAG: hypothetical protein ACI4RC_05250 [Oscillospiraceae bacterium]
MKYKKTPQNKRETYKLFDDNGKFVTEYSPGEDGITEVDILHLHKMDDHEVYVNNKERNLPEWYKPKYETWRKKYIENFKDKSGREPFQDEIPGGHLQYETWEQQVASDGDELGDYSHLEEETAVQFEEEIPDAVYRLHEIIAEMPEKWQEIYHMVLIESMTKTAAGHALGISDVRVGQIVKKINARIAADKELKKIFTDTSE